MTADQMNYEFEVGYDRITNFDSPGYTNKEKSTFLTKAQEELVLDMLRNKDHYKEDFKKSLSKLKTFSEILAAAFVASSGNYPSGIVAVVPATSLWIINDRVALSTTANHFYPSNTTAFTDVAVKPIDDDYYHANKNNPYKKPTTDLVWRIDQGVANAKHHVYICEKECTITKVIMHYYRKPEPIIIKDAGYVAGDGSIDGVAWSTKTTAGLDCELDAILHREIVDKAVKLAYAAIQDQAGFQLSTAQEKQKQ
jgi:hypothetical protein